MYSSIDLCERIVSLYPEIGKCGKDVNVFYDYSENSWLVRLNKGSYTLDHFLELQKADKCMDKEQCVSLCLEIDRLKEDAERKQFEIQHR